MITLEISSTDIRLMQTEGNRVVRWASRSLEADMFEEEVAVDPQALSAAVKQLMNSSGIEGKNIIASISGLYSVSRIIMVPVPLGGTANREAILDAAMAVMPLSEYELYLSWQTMATIEGGLQVMVVGVPRDVIDSEIQALRAARLNPRVLDLKAMALARAVDREQAIILNIELTSFDIVMVVDGVAEVMRTTAWHPGDLSTEDRAEHLTIALELTAGFYNSHHVGFPLDPATPLFITGQMSANLALTEELQARVGYPVEPLTPPLEYPEHCPVSQYAVNIGLALKGTAASKNVRQEGQGLPDFNLLPDIYKPWRPSSRQIYLFLAMVAAIVLLFPLYQVTTEAMQKTATLEARYDTVNTELIRRQTEIRKSEPLQKTITQYNALVDMGGGFVEDLQVITSKADELGTEVGSISHNGISITFTCQAKSYLVFRDYITALEESGRFTTPVTPPEGYPYVDGGAIKLKPKTGE